MQSWLCLLCSSYFSLQQSGLESATRARCRAGSAPLRASPRSCRWLRGFARLCHCTVIHVSPSVLAGAQADVLSAQPCLPVAGLWMWQRVWLCSLASPRQEEGSQVRQRAGGAGAGACVGRGVGATHAHLASQTCCCATVRLCLPGLPWLFCLLLRLLGIEAYGRRLGCQGQPVCVMSSSVWGDLPMEKMEVFRIACIDVLFLEVFKKRVAMVQRDVVMCQQLD